MKKYALALSLVGLAIQAFGAGFMLYGVNNNEKLYWIGIMICLVGMMVIAVGLISMAMKKK